MQIVSQLTQIVSQLAQIVSQLTQIVSQLAQIVSQLTQIVSQLTQIRTAANCQSKHEVPASQLMIFLNGRLLFLKKSKETNVAIHTVHDLTINMSSNMCAL